MTTNPLPPDLDTPPTDFFDPPLDLSGLVGRTADEATNWGERQGFEFIRVVHPMDEVELDDNPRRLTIHVDDDGIVTRASVS